MRCGIPALKSIYRDAIFNESCIDERHIDRIAAKGISMAKSRTRREFGIFGLPAGLLDPAAA
jgi:hypothetical protein